MTDLPLDPYDNAEPGTPAPPPLDEARDIVGATPPPQAEDYGVRVVVVRCLDGRSVVTSADHKHWYHQSGGWRPLPDGTEFRLGVHQYDCDAMRNRDWAIRDWPAYAAGLKPATPKPASPLDVALDRAMLDAQAAAADDKIIDADLGEMYRDCEPVDIKRLGCGARLTYYMTDTDAAAKKNRDDLKVLPDREMVETMLYGIAARMRAAGVGDTQRRAVLRDTIACVVPVLCDGDDYADKLREMHVERIAEQDAEREDEYERDGGDAAYRRAEDHINKARGK